MSIKKLIWTKSYQPFIMGGDVNRPIGCMWDVEGPFDIGKGRKAYLGFDPGGQPFAIEGATGAIIGDTIEQVRGHVEKAEESIMIEQIEWAVQERQKVECLSADKFWKFRNG